MNFDVLFFTEEYGDICFYKIRLSTNYVHNITDTIYFYSTHTSVYIIFLHYSYL